VDNMYQYGNPQYPELYYRMYPIVEDCIERYLRENPVNPSLTEGQMQELVDEVYERIIKDCPEIDQDPDEKGNRNTQRIGTQQRPFYGRRRLTRDMISVVLLSRLIGRRYPRYDYPEYRQPRYDYPEYRQPRYDYPGYGYPGYDYRRY